MSNLQKLIEKIFEESKDNVVIVDENSNKVSINNILDYRDLERVLSRRYDRVDFERIESTLLSLSGLSKWGNEIATHIGTIDRLKVMEEGSSYNTKIFDKDTNFNLIKIDRINLLELSIYSDCFINFDNISDWTKFFSGTKIGELYCYCSCSTGPWNKEMYGSEKLITGLDIEDLVIEDCCIPGYKYEIEYIDDYYGFEEANDFKEWFIEELKDEDKIKIKNYIQSILDTNRIENVYVKDGRSLISYETDNKAYHGVFDLKEYLKL